LVRADSCGTLFPVEDLTDAKTCPRCSVNKPASDFHRSQQTSDGLNSYCKPCTAEYGREYAPRRRSLRRSGDRRAALRAAERKYRLDRKYGLTLDEYHEMLSAQGSTCAICEADEPGGRGSWHVDHCHSGGHVRGILCFRCNFALGLLRDDPSIFSRAAEYLLKPEREG
jgi:hypothetical protein